MEVVCTLIGLLLIGAATTSTRWPAARATLLEKGRSEEPLHIGLLTDNVSVVDRRGGFGGVGGGADLFLFIDVFLSCIIRIGTRRNAWLLIVSFVGWWWTWG